MPDSELTDLLRIAHKAVDHASAMLRTRRPGAVTMKGDRDPATEVDYAIEQEARDFLSDAAPGIGFLGEEGGQSGGGRSQMWALDPIDGTVNFIHGLPLCGVSLALIDSGRPVLGVVDLPFLAARYSAVAGGGAHRGDTPIRVAQVESLGQAVVALGDYAVGANAEAKNADRFSITRNLVARVERVRMFGSAATDLVWMAEGSITASVMLSNKPWDTMAGVLIAREAGGLILDIHGNDHTIDSDSTIAVPPQLANELLRMLRMR